VSYIYTFPRTKKQDWGRGKKPVPGWNKGGTENGTYIIYSYLI
jgi:hypothetical protein